MSDINSVVWSEGMFLRPQHFQQQERYLTFQNTHILKTAEPYRWGLFDLEIDKNLLGLGQFGLNQLQCVFQDGTVALLPDHAKLPTAISVNEGVIDQLVYIAVPINKSTSLNVSDISDPSITRYKFHDQNVMDTTIGSDGLETLQLGQLNCQLKMQSEDRSGYISFPIAKIIEVTEEGIVLLDKKYIPPCYSIQHFPMLLNLTSEIAGMIKQRADVLAARLNQSQGSANAISDFLMLQLLNKYQPVFEHYQTLNGLHPETLYTSLISFAGELATFSTPEKRSKPMPIYKHEELTVIFGYCMSVINHGLSSVLEQTAIKLPLKERQFGVHVAPINDKKLLDRADLILAVKADVANEEIRLYLPSQIKIGSVDTIRDLVNNQLTGVKLINLPVAPRQVPFHSGYHYFQLEKTSVHWEKIKMSAGIALHFSGNYPGLALELWAINS